MNPDVSTAILFLGIVTVICITVIICTFIDRSHEKWCILHKTEPKRNNTNTGDYLL